MTANAPPSFQEYGQRWGMFFQIITAFAMSMTHFQQAASMAFGGVITEQLTSPRTNTTNEAVTLDHHQVSWITSIWSVGNLVGCMLSSYVNPWLGTLRILQVCSPFVVVGWCMMALGNTFWVILLGRCIIGFMTGTSAPPTCTHLGEISSVNARSALTLMMLVNGCIGIISAYLFGWLLGWRKACFVIGIAPMVLQFLITLTLPRSAKWLISKSYPEEARRSLRFYHGKNYDVEKEIIEIRDSLGETHKHNASFLDVLYLLKLRHIRIPFSLVLTNNIFFVFSGGLATTAFAPVIFKQAGGFDNPYFGSIMLGSARLLATIISSIVMEKVQRKSLLMLNGVVGTVGCLAMGLYFFFSHALEQYGWISLVCVLLIVTSMSLGISPLVNVLFTELLPNAIRAQMGGLAFTFFGACNFVMTYMFPLAASYMGMYGVYWFFAVMHALMFVYALLCLPHTGGKTIEEIQKMFMVNVTNTAIEPTHLHVDVQQNEVCVKDFENNV